MKNELSKRRIIFWTIILVSVIIVGLMLGASMIYQVQDKQARATMVAVPTMTAEALEFYYQKGLGYINIGRWQDAKVTLELVFNKDPNYKDVQAKLIEVGAKLTESKPTTSISPGLSSTSGGDLIAYYPFDGDTEDKSDNGHDGTIYGAQWVEGKVGRALEFDGKDDYVSANGYYDFSSTNQITLMAWMKLTDHSDFDGVLSAYNCCSYRLLISPQLHPYYNAGMHNDVQVTSFNVQVGEWYHYAMTIEGRQATIFINGEKVFKSAQGIPTILPDTSDAFIIGSGEKGGSSEKPIHPMQGIVDEVRIYRRALTEAEIQTLYQENQ